MTIRKASVFRRAETILPIEQRENAPYVQRLPIWTHYGFTSSISWYAAKKTVIVPMACTIQFLKKWVGFFRAGAPFDSEDSYLQKYFKCVVEGTKLLHNKYISSLLRSISWLVQGIRYHVWNKCIIYNIVNISEINPQSVSIQQVTCYIYFLAVHVYAIVAIEAFGTGQQIWYNLGYGDKMSCGKSICRT